MLPTYLLLLVVLFVILHYYFNIALLQFISILHLKETYNSCYGLYNTQYFIQRNDIYIFISSFQMDGYIYR